MTAPRPPGRAGSKTTSARGSGKERPPAGSDGDLHHVEAKSLAIERRRRGRGFSFHHADGRPVTDRETLERIRRLAIPPAYHDVRIAADPRAHIQAVGRDDKGRLQYRYHPEWEQVREADKQDHLAMVLACLPRLRRSVARDLADSRMSRTKAAAAAVALIDAGAIRVGCEAYLRSSGSRGASTLLKKDVTVTGDAVRLTFTGKGGKSIACAIRDPRLARALKRMAKLPGRRLLQYCDASGRPHRISAADVNTYLRRVAGRPISAKDLRMLAASAAAAERLVGMEPAPSESRRRKQLATVMAEVSKHLSNTPAVVRKSYVHRVVVDGFVDGSLRQSWLTSRRDGERERIENALNRLVRARAAPGRKPAHVKT